MDTETPLPSSGEQERKNRARDRVQRRKERQQRTVRTTMAPAVRPAGSRGVGTSSGASDTAFGQLKAKVRDVKSLANRNLPQIDFTRVKYLVYIGAGIGFMLLVIFLLGQFKNEAAEAPPNAIWVGEEWTYQRRPEEEMSFFAEQLRDHRIGQVYALVSYLNFDNTWSGDVNQTNHFEEVQENVQTFVSDFKAAYPEARLYGWLVIPMGQGRLNEPAVRQTIAQFSSRLVGEFGFDGVFLGVEPVGNNDTGFVDLLRDVRASVGADASIAVAVPPDWTPAVDGLVLPPIYAPGTFWDETYKRQVALLADLMIITAYNTGFTNAADYSAWVAYQVEAFGAAISEIDGTHILIGISTQDLLRDGGTGLVIHNPAAENINSALEGVRAGLEQLGDNADVLAGVALFSSQTTDQSDWTLLRLGWLSE